MNCKYTYMFIKSSMMYVPWRFILLKGGPYFYCTRHPFFSPFLCGVVRALASVGVCPGVETAAWIELVSLLKQSLRWEKVWSNFELDKMHGLGQLGSNSCKGASIGRIIGARGVLSVWPVSISSQEAVCSGEALVLREFENGDGVWYPSSSSLIESTGELWVLNTPASLSPWQGLACDPVHDAAWCCLLEIPQPSYNANNSQREAEFLYQLRMRPLWNVWYSIAHPNLCERRGFWFFTGLLTIPPIIAGFSPLNRKDNEGDGCGDRKLLMQSKSIEAAIIALKCVFFYCSTRHQNWNRKWRDAAHGGSSLDDACWLLGAVVFI